MLRYDTAEDSVDWTNVGLALYDTDTPLVDICVV